MISFFDRVWHRRPLALVSSIFTLGIGVGLHSAASINAWLLVFCAAVCILIATLIIKWYHAGFILMLAFAIGGVLSANCMMPKADYVARTNAYIKGYVASEPVLKDNRLSFDIASVELDLAEKSGKLRIYINNWKESMVAPSFGQRISIIGGRVWLAQEARNPNGFDFREWEYTKSIYANVNAAADSLKLHDEYKESLAKFFIDTRNLISLRVDTLFGEQARVISGMILGDKQGIPEDILDGYYSTGLSHILAISGTHIVYIMYLLNLLLNQIRVKRKLLRFTIIIISLVGYTLLVGAPASVIRAVILVGLGLLAPMLGRRSDNVTTLSAALMVLLLFNPASLLDVGFQLTFSAVAGISFLFPRIDRALSTAIFKLFKIKNHLIVKCIKGTISIFALGVAVTIFSIPILLYHFSEVPLISLIASVVVMPIIALAMPLAVVAICLSYLLPAVAIYIGMAVEFLYWVFGTFVEWFASYPLKLTMAPLPSLFVCIYYLSIYASSEYSSINKKMKSVVFFSLPIIVLVGTIFNYNNLPNGLTYTQLDAGQADAAVIQYRNKAWLIDCGSENSPSDEYLLKNGLILEDVFLSHAHDDHAGGLMEILDKNVPKRIYLPYGWQSGDIDNNSIMAIKFAQTCGSQLIELKAGDEIALPFGAVVTIFSPYESNRSLSIDANNSSLLLRLTYEGRSLLLTGDMEMSAEPDYLPQSDVLKVAHHGSPDATSQHFLSLVNPSVALISSGYNSYGHPSKEVLKRIDDINADVFRTDEYGAISVNISETGELTVSTFLAGSEDK